MRVSHRASEYLALFAAGFTVTEISRRTLMRERPELAMKLAVRGMMPRNVISKDSMSRLKIYRGGEHEHAAQKPELWAL